MLLMKPYSEFSAEELAMEKLFIRWVRFPEDPSMSNYWEGLVAENPVMKETVQTAKELVRQASDWKPESISGQEANSLWERIRNSLDIITDKEAGKSSGGLLLMKGSTSALLIGLVFLGLILVLFYFSLVK